MKKSKIIGLILGFVMTFSLIATNLVVNAYDPLWGYKYVWETGKVVWNHVNDLLGVGKSDTNNHCDLPATGVELSDFVSYFGFNGSTPFNPATDKYFYLRFDEPIQDLGSYQLSYHTGYFLYMTSDVNISFTNGICTIDLGQEMPMYRSRKSCDYRPSNGVYTHSNSYAMLTTSYFSIRFIEINLSSSGNYLIRGRRADTTVSFTCNSDEVLQIMSNFEGIQDIDYESTSETRCGLNTEIEYKDFKSFFSFNGSPMHNPITDKYFYFRAEDPYVDCGSYDLGYHLGYFIYTKNNPTVTFSGGICTIDFGQNTPIYYARKACEYKKNDYLYTHSNSATISSSRFYNIRWLQINIGGNQSYYMRGMREDTSIQFTYTEDNVHSVQSNIEGSNSEYIPVVTTTTKAVTTTQTTTTTTNNDPNYPNYTYPVYTPYEPPEDGWGSGLLEVLLNFIMALLTLITDTFFKIVQVLFELGDRIGNIISGLLSGLLSALAYLGDRIVEIVLHLLDKVTELFEHLITELKELILGMFDRLCDLILDILDRLIDLLIYLFIPSEGLFSELYDLLTGKFSFFSQLGGLLNILVSGEFIPQKFEYTATVLGVEVKFIDLDNFDAYIPIMHKIILSFAWVGFIIRTYKRVPAIIANTGGG